MEQKFVDRLIVVLEEEKDLYLCLHKLSERKTEVIVKRDIVALDKIVEAEQHILIKLGETERKREESIMSIALSLNIAEEVITTSSIIEILNKQKQPTHKLRNVTEELKTILEKQKQQNTTNMRLIQNNLFYIKEVIQRLVVGDEKLYTELGSRKTAQMRNIIDESV